MQPRHIAILGGGPIGLEAALAAAAAGLPFTLYERSAEGAGAVRAWGHVRVFTPWSMTVSAPMRTALAAAGRALPDGEVCPTGQQLVDRVLAPLAELPALRPHLRLGVRVLAVGRQGLLKHEEIASPVRAAQPFRLLLEDGARQWIEPADVVLDCTGTYGHANWLGDGGIPAPGELTLADRIVRTIPDFTRAGERWAGATTLLVGAGHSAQTAARDLAALAERHPDTRVVWALRGAAPRFSIAGDALPERARLTTAAQALVEGASPYVAPRLGVAVDFLRTQDGQLAVGLRGVAGAEEIRVDQVLALTGFVGDPGLTRQLQVHECYALAAPMKLSAALLAAAGGGADCLDQASHGADALKNPEPNFFVLGAKSYGRNSSFLMRVGYEQVREVFGLLAAA